MHCSARESVTIDVNNMFKLQATTLRGLSRPHAVADDGAAAVGSAGVTGLPGAVVELLTAAADVRLIKEALEGPLGRAEVLTAAGLTAGVAITAALFRAIRTKLDRIPPAGGLFGA